MTIQTSTSARNYPTAKQWFVEAIELSAQLRKQVRASLATDDDFRSLQRALEAIPIGANDYAWLQTRVRNARVYTNRRELCAADYELALVANRLLSRRRLWQDVTTHENA